MDIMAYEHLCVKPSCGAKYSDDDPEAYYCLPCREKNKELALTIQKKIASQPRKPVLSDFQRYEAITHEKGTKFIHIKDLGL